MKELQIEIVYLTLSILIDNEEHLKPKAVQN